MGYDIQQVSFTVRLERHNGPQDKLDDEALSALIMEINALVDSNPAYKRIVSWIG